MLWGREHCVIRNHLTGTQKRNDSSYFFFPLIRTERGAGGGQAKPKRDRKKDRRGEVRGGGGGLKKCELLLLCDLLKSLGEHSGSVRTKEGGESVLSPLCREQLMLD